MRNKITHLKGKRLSTFIMLLAVSLTSAFASPLLIEKEQFEIDTIQYTMYQGRLVDMNSNSPLIFANIVVENTNVATITNSDGEFSLKIAKTLNAKNVVFSHIGYSSKKLAIKDLTKNKNVIQLKQKTLPLSAVNIYPYDADFLVRHIMSKVDENYSNSPNSMKGFYRETIKKNRSYVGISEAVVDIYKAGYLSTKKDHIHIYKGRKSEDVSKMDTLVFKLQGGPSTVLMFDIIKTPAALLSPSYIDAYNYSIESIVMINDQPHYVVKFEQKKGSDDPLYNGKYYIHTNSLALTSAEFSLNLDNIKEATNLLIRKKPLGLKVTAKQVNYLVQYREQNGRWYFNYARGEMVLKFNWKKRLFNTNYSAMMEIAITDRSNTVTEPMKRSNRFKQNQVFSEQVLQFTDDNFWGHHNTIEPDESIQSAIKKLKKKGRF